MSEIDVSKFEKLSPRVCKNGKTRSEVAKYARRRGKAGEHYIVDVLKEVSGLPWLRISSSGAYIGKTNRERIFEFTEEQNESMLGDIYPPNLLYFRYIIESKNYGNFPFKKLSEGQIPAKLNLWIDELSYDVETYLLFKEKTKPTARSAMPFLMFKILRQGSWICYNKQYYEHHGINVFNPTYKINKTISDKLHQYNFGDTFFIESFEPFIQNNKIKLFEVK